MTTVTSDAERLKRTHQMIAGVWLVGTSAALLVTLWSLATQDHDGLNNLLQWPFGLPWMLLAGFWGLTSVGWAWFAAGSGVLNAVLIYGWLRSQANLEEQRRLLERARQGRPG